ncbi:ribosomal protein L17 [Choiromyces venosus 120613-1]|uniref:Ribosomal protein L17 n=1 Tax=Choiromyces venosus 120613-1 TaxID=1336337 RepID=A0A3N4J057_9PEZI|nr:ribosomal protein L17 [Choiromyces venosus 120613-1]
MAGNKAFRALSRSSSHRNALLRNLVTDLVKHESISTTYAKAKEAQSIAEKVITLGKRQTDAATRRLHQILYAPEENVPRVLNVLAPRYKLREGGYTRVQRIEPLKTDQAPSAILEFVDGPRDMRFWMTARTIAHSRKEGKELSDITLLNVKKVTRFRKNGQKELEAAIKKFEAMP